MNKNTKPDKNDDAEYNKMLKKMLLTKPTPTPAIAKNSSKPQIQLVISRYNEDLAWLYQPPFNRYPHIIYNKGINNNFFTSGKTMAVIPLKNVGRCDETYLNHIVNKYDELAEITVFLPGSLNISHKYIKALILLERLEAHQDTVFIGKNVTDFSELYPFFLDEWCSTDEKNKSINPEYKLEPASIRPFGEWYKFHFPNLNLYFVSYVGIFSVNRGDIQGHPISHYEKFLVQLQNSSNPEVGHYIERSWISIFHPFRNAKFN
jgi:hypothetical protein